jgi:hypothetical protein
MAMKLHIFSYRYAREILEHPNNADAWKEISSILSDAPIFTFPGKSRNPQLLIVQQLMNTYFDRRFAVDCGWQYHPRATGIESSGLAADFRKKFSHITIQTEVQFGNMARWYSDIFKFQAAYSQSLIQCGLCVVPMGSMARIIDSNVAHYERAVRELPSAELSISLPILLIGLEQDATTPAVDVSKAQFGGIKDVIKTANRWRIVNGYLAKVDMAAIGPNSDPGKMPVSLTDLDDEPGEPSESIT